MDQLKQLRKSRMQALASGQRVQVDFRAQLRAEDGNVFHMYIYDMIDDWFGVSASMVVEALLQAAGRDIKVHINSPGGSVVEGFAIYNNIKNYGANVEVLIEGGALSAASFIAMAGNSIKMEPAALMMLHDAWDFVAGNEADMLKAATTLGQASDTMAEIYAKKAGGTPASWRAILKEERWYTSQEALDAGLVDEVLSSETANAQAKWTATFAPVEFLTPAATGTGSVDEAEWNALRESLKEAFK